MEYHKASEYALSRLRNELPEILYYHCYNHVLDVLRSAESLAEREGITGEDLELLRTAVLFHDSGFVIQLQNHEEVGCGIVRVVLPGFGYDETQIEKICGMIMATRIPQTPHNLLEQIICDADLDYLGRDDFWSIGRNLYRELVELGLLKTEEDWNRLQLKFLTSHTYFTESAKMLRAEKKELHLNEIKRIVESYSE